jgi:hypothetical protein
MSSSTDERRTRVRASKPAIEAALRALRDAGVSVDKLCVNGGQVEIHCGRVEQARQPVDDGGLEEW